jgi:hypothetical protein
MNLPARPGVSAAHRARVLRALGVTPWVRRSVTPGPVEAAADRLASDGAIGFGPRCVVVLAEDEGERELGLLDRALESAGPALAQAARVAAHDGQLVDVPPAEAYLVFGEAQAHALGRTLAAEVLQRAQIVLVDPLPTLLCDPAAKRRLWMALRGLRRTLAAVAD